MGTRGNGSAVSTARDLVNRLLASGLRHAVLSPGSRSAALALALHAADAQGLIRLHVRVDEREAGFLALGLAKVAREPVPVVTTSGTAVANLHPAMLEALHSRIPLIAVTADRPARLRGTGANQTTAQTDIFPGIATIDRLLHVLAYRGGTQLAPMHLNLQFDDPLVEPVGWEFDTGQEPGELSAEQAGSAAPDGWRLPGADVARTVVVAGDSAGVRARQVAEAAGWPLLAEPSSGARGGANVVRAYRPLLAGELGAQIERVVSFGHPTLSRPVTALLGRADVQIVHVGDQSTFPLPAGANVTFVDGPSTQSVSVEPTPGDWLEEWRSADAAALAALPDDDRYLVAQSVWESVGDGDALFVGASNPVRDLDLVAGPTEATVLSNRGLAGIDGNLSTAIGVALAGGYGRAIAYVGDLTFLHGSNGLLIGPDEPRPDLTIVVLNDDGGGIFSGLEQGAPQYAASFERVFGTPTGADLAMICAGYGVPHRLVAAADLAAALTRPPDGIEVVEVQIARTAAA